MDRSPDTHAASNSRPALRLVPDPELSDEQRFMRDLAERTMAGTGALVLADDFTEAPRPRHLFLIKG